MAQKEMRNRRDKLIADLEETLKNLKESTSDLQTTQSRIDNECLVLRDKNSLLEKIIVEKGILDSY